MGRSCDVLVLGTGVAGLALAARLATSAGPRRTVILVDHRPAPVTGRAWAYWSARHTPLDDAVSHSWSRLVVIAGGSRTELHPHPYTYRLVRGEDLQALVDGLIRRAGGFDRLTGEVGRIEDHPDAAVVPVAGDEVRARWVLDSRPPPAPPPGQARLRFLGWEVAVDGPRFDPGCATFMDFRARAAGQVRFCYVLPTERDRALVEIAAFGTGSAAPGTGSAAPGTGSAAPGTGSAAVGTGPAWRQELADALSGYLHDVCGATSWRLLRHEAGELPLHVERPRRAGPRVLRVGTAGGMLKASTGYAYDRIVRDADAVVSSLDRNGHPWSVPHRHRRHAWLDQVLLEVVAREPDAVEPAFARLFARNPPTRVLRFLDEDTGLGEELRLITGLPPAPFVRAALRRRRDLPT